MKTASTYPATWPGTAIIRSTHNAFNWRDQPSLIPLEPQQGKRGPKPQSGLAHNNGRIAGLSAKADRLLVVGHGGAYSKAVAA